MFNQSAAWYDAFYRAKNYADEADQVATLIRARHPQARTLLDVGCGTGRHLEHLGARFACAGVDLDPGLLTVARRRLPEVPLVQADMTEFDLGRRFDAVTCLFSSIGYVGSIQRLHAAVGCMTKHLHPDGVLIVEPWNPARRLDRGGQPGRRRRRGRPQAGPCHHQPPSRCADDPAHALRRRRGRRDHQRRRTP